VLNATTAEEIGGVLKPILPVDTVLCTGGSSVLARVARDLGIEHHPINISSGVRVVGAWHVQNVNAFGNWLHGRMLRFKRVSSHCLDNYLGGFRPSTCPLGLAWNSHLCWPWRSALVGVISIREKSFSNQIKRFVT
jgi:hypothetical protein